MRLASILAVTFLTACVPSSNPSDTAQASMNRPREAGAAAPAPAVIAAAASFTAVTPSRAQRSNAEIAQDFLDLQFRMESGRPLPMLTRFEGPITVALRGQVPASASTDLARLLGRFRSEAGINISQTSGDASITVEFVPRRTIRTTYANVACFVVPNVSSWEEFKAARGTGRLDWATVRERTRAAVFAPSDASPQEIRDCLHEEMAQAMGPLNDLYQLPDSVFNDDNFHTVLTGFDMLVLRAHYSPQLRSGMTQAQVAAVLPGLLAQLNPAGGGGRSHNGGRTPPAWVKSMEAALGASGGVGAKRAAADRAVQIARAQGWADGRLAFSHFAVGRLSIGQDPVAAANAFAEAARIYRSLPGAHVQAAHVDMQLAALALSQGRADQAISFADRAIPVVRRAENASLLATLMMLKAEALDLAGDSGAARAQRLDSQAWARYGFGSDAVARARQRDISSLAPSRLSMAIRG